MTSYSSSSLKNSDLRAIVSRPSLLCSETRPTTLVLMTNSNAAVSIAAPACRCLRALHCSRQSGRRRLRLRPARRGRPLSSRLNTVKLAIAPLLNEVAEFSRVGMFRCKSLPRLRIQPRRAGIFRQ